MHRGFLESSYEEAPFPILISGQHTLGKGRIDTPVFRHDFICVFQPTASDQCKSNCQKIMWSVIPRPWHPIWPGVWLPAKSDSLSYFFIHYDCKDPRLQQMCACSSIDLYFERLSRNWSTGTKSDDITDRKPWKIRWSWEIELSGQPDQSRWRTTDAQWEWFMRWEVYAAAQYDWLKFLLIRMWPLPEDMTCSCHKRGSIWKESTWQLWIKLCVRRQLSELRLVILYL